MTEKLLLGSNEGQSLRFTLNNISEEQWEKFQIRVGIWLHKGSGQSVEASQKAAGDIVREAVRKALEAEDRFDPAKGNVLGWLWGFVSHELQHLYRDGYYDGEIYRDKQFLRSSELGDETPEAPEGLFGRLGISSPSPDQQSTLEIEEFVAQTLSPAEQELVSFLRLGYESEEIAAHYGTPTGTIHTRLSRLRQKLRMALSELENNKADK